MTAKQVPLTQQSSLVLTKAVLKLAAFWELSQRDISSILGISEATTTRLFHGRKTLSMDTKEGEIALILVRIYRSLHAILGQDPKLAKDWLHHYNDYFQTTPFQKMTTLSGLVMVSNYLDAMRGR